VDTTLMTMTETEGRVQHRTRVERAILAATHGLLADRAAAEVTIADIMDVVGLSRTAFYRYFPDVNSVLVRLLREVQAEFVGTWLEAPDDADFTEVLRADSEDNVERFIAHGAIIGACLDARTTAPELYVAWLGVVEETVARAAVRIEGLNRRGVTQVRTPAETARALITFTIYYVTEGLARVTEPDHAALVETLSAVWFRTIFGVG
jgi:TetR/AcrR family transcriptional regulator, ethionamide resistance regulator